MHGLVEYFRWSLVDIAEPNNTALSTPRLVLLLIGCAPHRCARQQSKPRLVNILPYSQSGIDDPIPVTEDLPGGELDQDRLVLHPPFSPKALP